MVTKQQRSFRHLYSYMTSIGLISTRIGKKSKRGWLWQFSISYICTLYLLKCISTSLVMCQKLKNFIPGVVRKSIHLAFTVMLKYRLYWYFRGVICHIVIWTGILLAFRICANSNGMISNKVYITFQTKSTDLVHNLWLGDSQYWCPNF